MWIEELYPIKLIEKSSERTKLTLTAIAASALTVIGIYSYQTARRHSRTLHFKEDLQKELQNELLPSTTFSVNEFGLIDSTSLLMNQHLQQQIKNNKTHDPTLVDEQLARNQAFLGEEGLSQVRKSCVIVIGVGSIGSWAGLMLARSGVQHLRLIDPSIIKPKDIANHAAASPLTIGQSKVKALEQMISHFAPFVTIEPIIDTWQPKYINLPPSSSKIIVVDCLNHTCIDKKIELIQFCHSRQIHIVSALDPGNKVDPTRIQMTDISDTFGKNNNNHIHYKKNHVDH